MDHPKSDDSAQRARRLDPHQRKEMLTDLTDLSDMLDEEDSTSPAFDDLPVLKSFVDPPTSPTRATAPRPVAGNTPSPADALRQQGATVINEIVARALPKLEAELRARLQAEWDALTRTLR